MGFSRGGAMMLRWLRYDLADTAGVRPSAFIALYPGCAQATLNVKTPDVPILILAGSEDTSSHVGSCERAAAQGRAIGKDVKVIIYRGYHGFDNKVARTLAFGARTSVCWPDDAIANRTRVDVLGTLRRAFGS